MSLDVEGFLKANSAWTVVSVVSICRSQGVDSVQSVLVL